MSPEEIHKIVSEAISANHVIPGWAYLLFILLPSIGAFFGAYAKRKGENLATKEDFENMLSQVKQQVEVVKGIEERITHDYLERREMLKIQREKLEQIYEALSADTERLAMNLSIAASDTNRDITFPSNRVEMLITLYFTEDFLSHLDTYRTKRNALITHIRQLCEANMYRNNQQESMQENLSQKSVSDRLLAEYTIAKNNIEVGLSEKMRSLTRVALGQPVIRSVSHSEEL